ncbi:MAG: hypothetical protein COZ09_12740 [Comamonadaceae bacterium CG_4_10_14_3_um_filter_60_42]|nr:MAG: hypothetical protein COZ09_12740 [Comamonadaceae bacterium CG_4_10_14_3_um_filter_60_42]
MGQRIGTSAASAGFKTDEIRQVISVDFPTGSQIQSFLSLVVRDRNGLGLALWMDGEIQPLVPLGQHLRPKLTE